MKLDENYKVESVHEALENVRIMKKRRGELLNIVAELNDKIEQYENHLIALDKFERSTEKNWIEKGEDPSPHYLTES